jgi:hypothetical protein
MKLSRKDQSQGKKKGARRPPQKVSWVRKSLTYFFFLPPFFAVFLAAFFFVAITSPPSRQLIDSFWARC